MLALRLDYRIWASARRSDVRSRHVADIAGPNLLMVRFRGKADIPIQGLIADAKRRLSRKLTSFEVAV